MTPIITIVGVGALGSHLVPLLRNVRAELRVVDFDRVEQRNVASQFHAKAGVGKTKVQALEQLVQFAFGLRIRGFPRRLGSENVKEILTGADLVVDCVDNGAARRLIQDHVRAAGTPCLHGALAADGALGRVIWDEVFTVDDEPAEGAATCEDGAHLPFVSVVASWLAVAVQRFVEKGERHGFHVFPGGTTRI